MLKKKDGPVSNYTQNYKYNDSAPLKKASTPN
jgi:hypothetical protein